RSCVTTSRRRSPGRLPERPKGADCKSAGSAFEGSNPSPATAREDPGDRHEKPVPGVFCVPGAEPEFRAGFFGIRLSVGSLLPGHGRVTKILCLAEFGV